MVNKTFLKKRAIISTNIKKKDLKKRENRYNLSARYWPNLLDNASIVYIGGNPGASGRTDPSAT